MNLFKKLLSLFLLLGILLIPSDVSARGGGCSVDLDAQIMSQNKIVFDVDWSSNTSWNNTLHHIRIWDRSSGSGKLIFDSGARPFMGPTTQTSGSYTLTRTGTNFRHGGTYSVVILANCRNAGVDFDYVDITR